MREQKFAETGAKCQNINRETEVITRYFIEKLKQQIVQVQCQHIQIRSNTTFLFLEFFKCILFLDIACRCSSTSITRFQNQLVLFGRAMVKVVRLGSSYSPTALKTLKLSLCSSNTPSKNVCNIEIRRKIVNPENEPLISKILTFCTVPYHVFRLK